MSEEEYDFEYSEEEEEEEENEMIIQIENQYYEAKTQVDQKNYAEAIKQFEIILSLETEPSHWGFKALKRLVKLHFMLNNYEQMMQRYDQLLGYTKTAVTRNISEKAVNKILDLVSNSKELNVLQELYEHTLGLLKETHNERLRFKTNIKLGNLLFERGEYRQLSKVIRELQQSFGAEENNDRERQGTLLLEVYALQIQMYTGQRDNKKLKEIYEKALRVRSGIPHPRIVGVIRECGGKMHMMENQWTEAGTDFFEGFKSYDEAGEPRRLQCLKYLVLANMLSESKINIFDSQEAKPYETDPEIAAMTYLTDAFLRDNIQEFENILRDNRQAVMEDNFIRHYIDNLLQTIRSKVLLKIIKPYRVIQLDYIAKELNNIDIPKVEKLLTTLIMDNKISGQIDQLKQCLYQTKSVMTNPSTSVVHLFDEWTTELNRLNNGVYSTILA